MSEDINVKYHEHNAVDSPRITPSNVAGMFKTVTAVPTATPSNFMDQIQLYLNGSDWELYVYDTSGSAWRKFNYYTP